MLNLLIGKNENTFESTCSDLTGLDNFFVKLPHAQLTYNIYGAPRYRRFYGQRLLRNSCVNSITCDGRMQQM